MRRITLDELARAPGVTAAHLSRTFGREFDGGIVALELVRLGRATRWTARAVVLLTLGATWNNRFLPLIMLQESDFYPITIGPSQWFAQAR